MPRRNLAEKLEEKLEEEVVEEVKEEVVEVDNVTKKKRKCFFHQGEQKESDRGNTDSCCNWNDDDADDDDDDDDDNDDGDDDVCSISGNIQGVNISLNEFGVYDHVLLCHENL